MEREGEDSIGDEKIVDDEIGRVRGGIDGDEEDRLGGHELLPLRAARAVDPGKEEREAGIGGVGVGGGLRLVGVGERRRRGRAVEGDLVAEEGVEAVRSGADARVSDSSKRAWFEVLVEGMRDAWSGSAVHGERRK